MFDAPNPYLFNGDPALAKRAATETTAAMIRTGQAFYFQAWWGIFVHDALKVASLNPFLAPFLPKVPMYLEPPKVAESD